MMWTWMWMASALAGPVHVVAAGDELAALAAGDPAVIAEICALNGLDASAPLEPGTVLRLPDTHLQSTTQAAFLVSSSGRVDVSVGAGAAKRLRKHESVSEGSTVCTLDGAQATLRLATQCTAEGQLSDDVMLAPDTCIVIETVYADTDRRSTVVRVLTGELMVKGNDAAGSVSILTTAGLTTGSSGGFRVTVEDEASRTEALYAPVSVAAQGETVSLDAGQGSRTVVGEAPGAAVDLLKAGQPVRPATGARLDRPDFAWTDVEGALGYRVEFAADEAFQEVLLFETVGGTPWAPRLLMLPWANGRRVYWRVASLDRLGFLGIPSAPFILDLPEGVSL